MSQDIVYRAACACGGKATTGRIVVKARRVGDSVEITATQYPGPVCDVCDKPWKKARRRKR
jgi:hypothetical protein